MVAAGRGDELVRLLRTGAASPDQLDQARLELLGEIFEGYPVEGVRRLLTSGRPSAVRAGAWIASEIGTSAGPLVADMATVLESGDGYAKFFAVDVVLLCGAEQHGQLIARVIELVDVGDVPLRWKALQFLTNATSKQVSAGTRHIESDRLRTLIEWLIRFSRTAADLEAVVERLASSDRTTRLVAAAAAARAATTQLDPAALEHAATLPDGETASFASEQLELMTIRRRSRPG